MSSLPWEREKERLCVKEGEAGVEAAEKGEMEPPKKKRFWGFKEDPYIYCKVTSLNLI